MRRRNSAVPRLQARIKTPRDRGSRATKRSRRIPRKASQKRTRERFERPQPISQTAFLFFADTPDAFLAGLKTSSVTDVFNQHSPDGLIPKYQDRPLALWWQGPSAHNSAHNSALNRIRYFPRAGSQRKHTSSISRLAQNDAARAPPVAQLAPTH